MHQDSTDAMNILMWKVDGMSAMKPTREAVEAWDDQIDNPFSADVSLTEDDFRRFLKIANPRTGETLLDVGCGNGDLLVAASWFGLRSYGLEDTPEAAVISQKTAPQAKVVLASEADLPFESGFFDLVTALNFAGFFPDVMEGLREIRRVLKPGGRACILLPNADFRSATGRREAEAQEEHAQTLRNWKKMLDQAGLNAVTFFSSETILQGETESRLASPWQRWKYRFRMWLAHWVPRRWTPYYVVFCYKD